jgi:hypothetical protein
MSPKLPGDDERPTPHVWKYLDIDVHYHNDLNGGGTLLAGPFVEFLRARDDRLPSACSAFEWCAGPAFIGFALLAERICSSLFLADINPDAVECVARTVAENGLQDRVQYCVSDNFKSMPADKRFDLVVANPPNFFSIDPDHPLGQVFHADRRPNDPEWRLHKDFYAGIGRYLNPGALVCVSEIEPHEALVRIPRSLDRPFDRRLAAPHDEFKQMIEAGGLTWIETVKFATLPGDVGAWMMVARKDLA